MKAICQGAILAESAQTILVEGNHCSPAESIRLECFLPSDTLITCPRKDVASYYDVVVDGKTNVDAAWYYPAPKDAAEYIKGYIAFWRGVKVEK